MKSQPVVYVVDDDDAVRKALSMLIKTAGLAVQAYDSAQAFLDNYSPHQPSCLILDVRMPGMSGMELQEKLINLNINIPIIIITGHGDVPMAVRAVQKGALDFIQKPFEDDMMLERIQKAIEIDTKNREERARQEEIEVRIARLSPREREVMDMLVDGKQTKEIAFHLGLSRKTVDIHRSHVMMKLGVGSVVELVRIGLSYRSHA